MAFHFFSFTEQGSIDVVLFLVHTSDLIDLIDQFVRQFETNNFINKDRCNY